MIGTILAIGSAIASLGSGIFSAVQNNKAKKAQEAALAQQKELLTQQEELRDQAITNQQNYLSESIDKQRSDNEAWYNRRYNEDATQRADTQAYLTQLRDLQRERTQATAGQAAVMGSSDAAVAAQKAADTKAQAQAISSAVSKSAEQKDEIESQYLSTKNSIDAQERAGQLSIEQARLDSLNESLAAQSELAAQQGNLQASYYSGTGSAVAQAASGLSSLAGAFAGSDSTWARGKKASSLESTWIKNSSTYTDEGWPMA